MKYKTGQIWIDEEGCQRKILGICDEVVFISISEDFEIADGDTYTKKELDDFLVKPVEEKWEPKKWEPKIGEDYYHLDTCGNCEIAVYYNDTADDFRKLVGNFFKTKKEVEAYKQKLINLNK